jgi:hypothetical protein
MCASENWCREGERQWRKARLSRNIAVFLGSFLVGEGPVEKGGFKKEGNLTISRVKKRKWMLSKNVM